MAKRKTATTRRVKKGTAEPGKRTKRTPPNRPGRPPGSSIKWAAAVEMPAVCPKCGSSELRSLGGSPTQRDTAGEINGEQFDRVIWKRRQCAGCGQHVMVRSYLRKVKREAE